MEKICQGLALYKTVVGMQINEKKSTISFCGLEEQEVRFIFFKFPFQARDLDEGLKYVGFFQKPNDGD